MLKVYKASAGSGKTYTLTLEYLRLLFQETLQGVPKRAHHHTLAVTFTKKATAEMKGRIIRELHVLATNPQQSPYWKDLTSDTALHLSQDELPKRAGELLISILQDYSRFSVSTIDAFFQQVIRTFALELGLPSSYNVTIDTDTIIQQAVDDLFRRLRLQDDGDTQVSSWIHMFTQQRIANGNKWNPKEDVSGFSSQLTKEALMSHIHAVRSFYSDKEQLKKYLSTLETIISTTEQRARTILLEIRRLLGTGEGVQAHILSAIRKDEKTLLAEGLGKMLLKILEDPHAIYTKGRTTAAQQMQLAALAEGQLGSLVRELKALTECIEYHSAKAIHKNLYFTGLLQDVAGQVEHTNRQLGRLPISDVNLLINDIIDGQDVPFLYERYGQQYHHYMIDEFQDTSTLQWKDFKPLIEEAHAKGYDNLLVGDVKQSIYRFRNSDWRTLQQIGKSEFTEAQTETMANNWRTSSVVVNANNQLFVQYAQWLVNTLSTDSVFRETNLTDILTDVYAATNVEQTPKKDLDGLVHWQFFSEEECKSTPEPVFAKLDSLIKEILQDGFRPSDIAMLVRYGNDAQVLASYLVKLGYNVQSAEGLLVKDNESIQLLIDLIAEPYTTKDPVMQYRLKSARETFISPEMDNLISEARHQPLLTQAFAIVDILKLNEKPGVLPYLYTFLDCLYQFTQERVADVESFLKWWEKAANKAAIPAPDNPDAIRILTIHKSKGLEFPVVIIPWLNWPIKKGRNHSDILWCEPTLPSLKAPLVAVNSDKALLKTCFKEAYQADELANCMDNLNLTYVAFTRPIHRLYAFGQDGRTMKTPTHVGHLISILLDDQLNENGVYHNESGNRHYQGGKREADSNSITTIPGQYNYENIANRLILRTRSLDDFTPQEQDVTAIQQGILMHDFLSHIDTLAQAPTYLAQLHEQGSISPTDEQYVTQQIAQLQRLLETSGHTDWFDGRYQVMTECEILTSFGKVYRPDRVMLDGKRAIVIDYKFGAHIQPSYVEQVRDYITLLQQMGYQPEGWIVYVALQTITPVL